MFVTHNIIYARAYAPSQEWQNNLNLQWRNVGLLDQDLRENRVYNKDTTELFNLYYPTHNQ